MKRFLVAVLLVLPTLAQAQCLYGTLERQWTQGFAETKGHDALSSYTAVYKGSLVLEKEVGPGAFFGRGSLLLGSERSPKEFSVGYKVPIWCVKPQAPCAPKAVAKSKCCKDGHK